MESMKKILLTLMIAFSLMHAGKRVVHVHYEISYAIFGVIGESDALLTIDTDAGTYETRIDAKAKGLARVMSGGRIERYVSRGRVEEGVLIPQIFSTLTRKGHRYEEQHRYRFLHREHTIVHTRRIREGQKSDFSEERLSWYARDDILTLFFNLRRYAQKGICPHYRCSLYAVGANEKDGRVDIAPAKKGILKVILHRRIFASKRGELYLHLTPEGISDYALLKDVIFFGDVKAKATTIAHRELPNKGER